MLQKLKAFAVTNWGVALLIAATTFVLISSVLVFGVTTFFTNLDNVDQFYTWYQKLATSIHQGYLPIWNANVFGGQSFAGELQPGVFYPVNIVWVWLFGSAAGISQLALDYLVAFHFALGAFGCYLLLKQMGASKWASYLTGIIFSFSGALAFRSISQTAIFFGLALLPFAVYFFIKAYNAQTKRVLWLLLSGVFLGLIILSGHIAPFYFALLICGLYALVHLWQRVKNVKTFKAELFRAIKNFAFVLLAMVVIAMPQLVVSAPYLNNSYRIQATGYAGPDEKIDYGHFAKSFSLDIHEFASLVDPVSYQIKDGNNLFIGLTSLGLIVLVVAVARRQFVATDMHKKHRAFIITLLVVGGIAMLGYVTWFAVVLYELPLVYQVRQLGRYSILFHLGLMAALAMALQVVAKVDLTKRQKWAVGGIGLFLLIESAYLTLLHQYIFSLHHALQVAVLALTLLALAIMRHMQARKVLLTAFILVTALVNTMWFLPVIKEDTKTPAYYQIEPILAAVLEQTNGQYRVEVQEEAIPMNTGNVYNVQTTWGYSATVYAPYYELTQKSGVDPELIKDLMGVRLVAQKQQPVEDQQVYSGRGVYVKERPTALPKFFTSHHPGATDRRSYSGLEVRTDTYKDQYQKYTVTTQGDTTAIISEIAYPGWVAKVDGVAAPLGTYPIADTPLLKTINLPAGTHTVELEYKPFGIF